MSETRGDGTQPARHRTRGMERWPEAVRSLITGRNPIEAYRDLLVGAPRGIKEVITLR